LVEYDRKYLAFVYLMLWKVEMVYWQPPMEGSRPKFLDDMSSVANMNLVTNILQSSLQYYDPSISLPYI